jgi:hypothetical protein
MADTSSKMDQLVNQIEIKFGNLDTFYVWLDGAALLMERSRIEAELNELKEAQKDSYQAFEDQIQLKQTEFDTIIQQMKFEQMASFEEQKKPIEAKQAELDAINKALQGK